MNIPNSLFFKCASTAFQWGKISFYAPNFEKVGSILLLACPFVCLFVCQLIEDDE